MTNSEVNKILLHEAKAKEKKHFYKRCGRCDPRKCGGACCRYTIAPMFDRDSYFAKITDWLKNPIDTVKYGKETFIVSPFHCPNITVGGRCKLHGTKKQSSICDMFPCQHDDPFYLYVKKVCSYRFEKTPIEMAEK